ncbi:MAG: diguanylate cyclase [Desulfobacter sp.]|nr:diguanylate cyclase [Desulfobacter sp.]WDP85623.1 MAG: diguanylate cyclase [Desulfobacter sp.]
MENQSWDGFPWKEMPCLRLENYMGAKPEHFPEVVVKLSYNTRAVFVMFQVKDRYVRALAGKDQDEVYKDSCVEFFFTPGPDLSKGYFNLEMNCGGTMLFHFQRQPREKRIHSLPSIVDPEIKAPVVWIVGYEIPFSLLKKYCRVSMPGPQTHWRVNFYKCGDKTSHPHWLTWSPIDLPAPDFHHPQSFGRLEFQ